MEILSIRLKATKSTWLELYNIYLPNTSTQLTSFNPSLIKPRPSSLILGDLNGHSQMWDSPQPQDKCGDEILDWILDNDLHILNNGSATRASRITGNDSTSDISLCGSSWSAKTSWRLAEPIGSSDHLPIIIEVNHKICYKPAISRSAWWRRNGVDWSCFTNEVESKMRSLPHEPNLSLQVSRFNEILISTVTTHVENSNQPRDLNLGWLHMCGPKNPQAKSPPQNNTSKSSGVGRRLSWSYRGNQSGQVRKLERSSARRDVKFRRSKHVESYSRSQRYSWCKLPQRSYVWQRSNYHWSQIQI